MPEEYLDMIRPYLRDLINDHKPTEGLNNEDNNNNNNNRAEWKIKLTMQNNCISSKNFEDTRTIYTKSEPVEIFMGSNTNNVIDRLFDSTLKRSQQAIKTSTEGSEFVHESVGLLYYHFQRLDIRRTESYIKSPDWIGSKKATINPKNERDNKWFSIISGLNYDKIKEKELKKILKFKRVDTEFSSYQRDLEEFEQNNS